MSINIEAYPGLLELPLPRTNFHGLKPVRAIEVLLYLNKHSCRARKMIFFPGQEKVRKFLDGILKVMAVAVSENILILLRRKFTL